MAAGHLMRAQRKSTSVAFALLAKIQHIMHDTLPPDEKPRLLNRTSDQFVRSCWMAERPNSSAEVVALSRRLVSHAM